MKISEIPVEIRPREKALRYGIDKLTDQELLAIIIGSGVKGCSALEIAGSLLQVNFNSLLNVSSCNLPDFLASKGLNKVNSLRLLATFEIHRRLSSSVYQKVCEINSFNELLTRFNFVKDFDKEVMIVVGLDSKNRIKCEKMMYQGTKKSIKVSASEILKELIMANAKKFYLIHNHPDENSEPSENDLITTRYIQVASEELYIHLLDHIIISQEGAYSIVENRSILEDKSFKNDEKINN